MSTSPLVLSGYTASQPSRASVWLRAWLPVLAFSMIFVIESTPYFGQDRTSAPLRRIFEALFGYDLCAYWDTIHHVIRKTGHFMGYGIFSLVSFRAFRMVLSQPARRLGDRLKAHGLAILATFLVAGADEFHQTFLPNRTGQFSDVLLDTSGAVALGLVVFLVMVAIDRIARGRQSGNLAQPVIQHQRSEDPAPVQKEGPALV